MGKLENIEHLIQDLSPEDLAKFREWFAQFEADTWDRQIETDANSGKLDFLIEEALAEHRAGKTTPL